MSQRLQFLASHRFSAQRRRLLILATASAAPIGGCGGGGGGGAALPGPPFVQVGTVPAPGVSGPAWWAFGRDAQHAANSAIGAQALNRIAWATPVDLSPQYSAGAAC